MLKKINQWLLTRWPVIWNTKALWALLILCALHLIVYLLGWSCFGGVEDFQVYYYYHSVLESVMWFTAIVVALFLIVWFIFYFRQNALKALYPLSRFYLLKEFMVLFGIVALLIQLFHSAQAGYYHSVRHKTSDFDLEKDARIINMASCFLPTDINVFERSQSCDSQHVQQLKNEAEMQEQPVETIEYCDMPGNDGEETAEYNEESFDDTVVQPVKEYSYLFYCSKVSYHDSLTQEHYHNIAERWLREGKKDSIRQSLQALKTLAARYHITEEINTTLYTALCFRDSSHSISPAQEYESPAQNINEAMERISLHRNLPPMSIQEVIALLYVSLVLSLVVFSFRITRIRTWIMALVGGLVWAIIIGAASIPNERDSFSHTIYVLACLFALTAVLLIRTKKLKALGGMALCWLMVIQLMLVPLIFWQVFKNTFEVRECVNHIMTVTRPEPPIHGWIDRNWETIHLGNMGLTVLLMFFVFLPLAIRWQANPEE